MDEKSVWKIILFILIAMSCDGQVLKSLTIQLDTTDQYIQIPASLVQIRQTEEGITQRVISWIDSLQDRGHLECHLQSLVSIDTMSIAHIHVGPLYRWTRWYVQEHDLELWLSRGLELPKLGSRELDVSESKVILKKILERLDERGYPFAQVYLDSSTITGNSMTSRLNVVQGPRILIDTVQLNEPIGISHHLVYKITGLQSGSPFKKRSILSLNQSLELFPFLESYADPQIIFYKNKAVVKLFLRDKKSSHLDALLGFLPGTGTDSRLKINGNFTGYFINQFRVGESIDINFQSLQSNSQNLKIELAIPFVFSLPFSPFAHFNLYKRDSLFLDLKWEAGAKWQLNRTATFSITLGAFNSNLLRPDLLMIRSLRRLPAALDINQRYLGSALVISHLDAKRNPQKGYSLTGSIRGSTRQIKPNASIVALKDPLDDTFSFSSLYRAYEKKGYAVDWGLEVLFFIPTMRYNTWYNSIRWFNKKASTSLQLNELYRLGGFNLLRGFDEESIFASQYLLWNTEWRLITGPLSYLFVHSDLARLNEYKVGIFKPASFWSIGAGLVFDTSLGLLSVSSSIGRRFPEGFDFKAVKLHVGYINYF